MFALIAYLLAVFAFDMIWWHALIVVLIASFSITINQN